jgi:hypothetical protein
MNHLVPFTDHAPALVRAAGERTSYRFFEFFTAIRAGDRARARLGRQAFRHPSGNKRTAALSLRSSCEVPRGH